MIKTCFCVFAVLYLVKYGVSVLCLRNLIFLCCLFCLSLADLERYRIPDEYLIVSAAAWAAAAPFAFREYGGWGGILFHLLAAIVYGGGILLLSILVGYVLKKDSLGGGDIKLFAVMGLYLGMTEAFFALFFACIFGLVLAVIRCRGDKKNDGVIPFGPAIAAATGMMLLYGSQLVEGYLRLV